MDDQSHKKNLKSGITMIAISICVTLMLALAFAVMNDSDVLFVEKLFESFELIFWLFGASGVLVGIIAITIPSIKDHAFGFGMALYYGTMILSALLEDVIIADDIVRLIISFVIITLISYVYWLKNLKPSE